MKDLKTLFFILVSTNAIMSTTIAIEIKTEKVTLVPDLQMIAFSFVSSQTADRNQSKFNFIEKNIAATFIGVGYELAPKLKPYVDFTGFIFKGRPRAIIIRSRKRKPLFYRPNTSYYKSKNFMDTNKGTLQDKLIWLRRKSENSYKSNQGKLTIPHNSSSYKELMNGRIKVQKLYLSLVQGKFCS